MAEDPSWQKFVGEVRELDAIQAQDIKIFRPAAFSPAIM